MSSVHFVVFLQHHSSALFSIALASSVQFFFCLQHCCLTPFSTTLTLPLLGFSSICNIIAKLYFLQHWHHVLDFFFYFQQHQHSFSFFFRASFCPFFLVYNCAFTLFLYLLSDSLFTIFSFVPFFAVFLCALSHLVFAEAHEAS